MRSTPATTTPHDRVRSMIPPRVVFFTTSYPCAPGDRIGPFVHALARSLRRLGTPVRVLAPATATARGVSILEGVEVERFRFLPARWSTLTAGFGGVPVALRRAPWRLLAVPPMLAAGAMASVRAARAADVLHAHWLPNLIPLAPAARLRHRPRVVTLWGSDVEWFERSTWLRRMFERVLRGADAVVAINEQMRALFAPIVGPARLHVIASGVDTELFHPRERAALRRRLQLALDDVVAVFAGSLIPRKGVDVAIDALSCSRRQAPFLVIVGEGPERAVLAQRAQQQGVAQRVRFVGEASVAEVAEWMAAADVFVLPSRYEGRPNVVLEAQATGLAVVASDIPGCRDLIEPGETGLLTRPGDPTALGDVLAMLVDDPALRVRLGNRARAAISDRRVTWEACAARYQEIYRAVA